MSAPDRPTREQVDADLARADLVHSGGTNEVRLIVHRLAAEVRALRAELDGHHVSLVEALELGERGGGGEWTWDEFRAYIAKAKGALVMTNATVKRRTAQLAEAVGHPDPENATWPEALLAALVARTPQPAGTVRVGDPCSWAEPEGGLNADVLNGVHEAGTGRDRGECRFCDEPIAVAPLPAVPDGMDEPDWHNMRERLHTEIGAIVGVTPREERTGDADGDLIEMVRRAVWSTSDGEDERESHDEPGLKAALAMAQVRQVLAWCDLADERGDGRLHSGTVRMVIASATPGASGPSPESLSVPDGEGETCGSCGHDADHSGGECMWIDNVYSDDGHMQIPCHCDGSPNPDTDPDDPLGEDVPARLDAAAEALASLGWSGTAEELRHITFLLKQDDAAEVRAAVAAALALPTGGVDS